MPISLNKNNIENELLKGQQIKDSIIQKIEFSQNYVPKKKLNQILQDPHNDYDLNPFGQEVCESPELFSKNIDDQVIQESNLLENTKYLQNQLINQSKNNSIRVIHGFVEDKDINKQQVDKNLTLEVARSRPEVNKRFESPNHRINRQEFPNDQELNLRYQNTQQHNQASRNQEYYRQMLFQKPLNLVKQNQFDIMSYSNDHMSDNRSINYPLDKHIPLTFNGQGELNQEEIQNEDCEVSNQPQDDVHSNYVDPFQNVDQLNEDINKAQGSNHLNQLIESLRFQQNTNSMPIRKQPSPMRSEHIYNLRRQQNLVADLPEFQQSHKNNFAQQSQIESHQARLSQLTMQSNFVISNNQQQMQRMPRHDLFRKQNLSELRQMNNSQINKVSVGRSSQKTQKYFVLNSITRQKNNASPNIREISKDNYQQMSLKNSDQKFQKSIDQEKQERRQSFKKSSMKRKRSQPSKRSNFHLKNEKVSQQDNLQLYQSISSQSSEFNRFGDIQLKQQKHRKSFDMELLKKGDRLSPLNIRTNARSTVCHLEQNDNVLKEKSSQINQSFYNNIKQIQQNIIKESQSHKDVELITEQHKSQNSHKSIKVTNYNDFDYNINNKQNESQNMSIKKDSNKDLVQNDQYPIKKSVTKIEKAENIFGESAIEKKAKKNQDSFSSTFEYISNISDDGDASDELVQIENSSGQEENEGVWVNGASLEQEQKNNEMVKQQINLSDHISEADIESDSIPISNDSDQWTNYEIKENEDMLKQIYTGSNQNILNPQEWIQEYVSDQQSHLDFIQSPTGMSQNFYNQEEDLSLQLALLSQFQKKDIQNTIQEQYSNISQFISKSSLQDYQEDQLENQDRYFVGAADFPQLSSDNYSEMTINPQSKQFSKSKKKSGRKHYKPVVQQSWSEQNSKDGRGSFKEISSLFKKQQLENFYRSFNQNERHTQGGWADTKYAFQDVNKLPIAKQKAQNDIWSNYRLEIQQSGVSREQKLNLNLLHQMYKKEKNILERNNYREQIVQYCDKENIKYSLKLLDENGKDIKQPIKNDDNSQEQRAKYLKDKRQKNNEQRQLDIKNFIKNVHNPIKEEEEGKDYSDDEDESNLLIPEANIDFSQDVANNNFNDFDDDDFSMSKVKWTKKSSSNNLKNSLGKEYPKKKEKLKRMGSKNALEADGQDLDAQGGSAGRKGSNKNNKRVQKQIAAKKSNGLQDDIDDQIYPNNEIEQKVDDADSQIELPSVSKFDPTVSNNSKKKNQPVKHSSQARDKVASDKSPSTSQGILSSFKSITSLFSKSNAKNDSKEILSNKVEEKVQMQANSKNSLQNLKQKRQSTASTTGFIKNSAIQQTKNISQNQNQESFSGTSGSYGSMIQSEQKMIDKSIDKPQNIKATIPTQHLKNLKWQYYNSIKIKDKVSIFLVCADITVDECDAIVNPSNSLLSNNTGISGQILSKGGAEVQQACQKYIKRYAEISQGSCMSTQAGKLPCKYVIHTPAPIWNNSATDPKSISELQKCVMSCLQRAQKLKKVKTISIPSISTGSLGGNPDIVATIILQACLTWSMTQSESKEQPILQNIRICNIDERMNQIFMDKLHKLFKAVNGFDRCHQDYIKWLQQQKSQFENSAQQTEKKQIQDIEENKEDQ